MIASSTAPGRHRAQDIGSLAEDIEMTPGAAAFVLFEDNGATLAVGLGTHLLGPDFFGLPNADGKTSDFGFVSNAPDLPAIAEVQQLE